MSYTQINKPKKQKQQYKTAKAKPVELEGLYLGDNNYERWLFELTKEEHNRLTSQFCKATDTASCFKYDDYRECLVAVGKLASHLKGETLDEQCMNQVCTVKGEIRRYTMSVTVEPEEDDNDGETSEETQTVKEELKTEQRGVSLVILSVTPLPFKKQPEAVREMLKEKQKGKRKESNQHNASKQKKNKSESEHVTQMMAVGDPEIE